MINFNLKTFQDYKKISRFLSLEYLILAFLLLIIIVLFWFFPKAKDFFFVFFYIYGFFCIGTSIYGLISFSKKRDKVFLTILDEIKKSESAHCSEGKVVDINKFVDSLNNFFKIPEFSSFDKNIVFVLSGNFHKRDFSFYRSKLISSQGTRLSPSYYIQTNPIKNITSTIFILRKSILPLAFKNLSKAKIETQGLFNIVTDNPQDINNILSKEFINALIDYGKTIDKEISFLITPHGILFIRQVKACDNIFPFIKFEKVIDNILKEYDDTKACIDLINLLEKK